MNFDPNPLFDEIFTIWQDNYDGKNKVVICNEGSSRSSKTWDTFHFILAYCFSHPDQNQEIYILRDTLTNCRDFTFKEFKNCMDAIGYKEIEYRAAGQKPECTIAGNTIYFRGLDDESNTEGYPSDIIFVNEALETKESKIAGLRMRCRKLMIFDWNPKYTEHWCFKMEGRPNHFFTHSTYKNNKHLQKSVIAEIESYCPWHFDDMHLPEKDRRPHPVNVETGTANEYRWKVYGEGRRAAPEGVIFDNVKYIDAMPVDVAPVLGIDFGFTSDPTAIVLVAETTTDIYLELLMYQSTETSREIDDYAIARGIDKKTPATADSADKYTGENKGTVEMVAELRQRGWAIRKVSKTQSVMFWLLKMKEKKINIVKNDLYHFARIEAENYRFKIVHGIKINQPIDDHNHFWDAARYGFMSLNSGGVRSLSI